MQAGWTFGKAFPNCSSSFLRYRAEKAPDLTLVLVGKAHMQLRKLSGVKALGYLPEGEKLEAFAEAVATVQPSPFESLSLVMLESWKLGTPVVANARSPVVAGQCARSGGGLTYSSYEDFAAALDRVRADEGRRLGEQGRRFVDAECSWERILGVYRRAVERACGGRR